MIEIIFKNINISTPSDLDGMIQLNIIVMFLGIVAFNTYNSRKFRRKLNNILVVLVAFVLVAFVLVAFVFVAFVLLGLVDSVTKKK